MIKLLQYRTGAGREQKEHRQRPPASHSNRIHYLYKRYMLYLLYFCTSVGGILAGANDNICYKGRSSATLAELNIM